MSTSSIFTVRSEMIGDRLSIETASELLLNGSRESSSLKKFCSFSSLIVRSSFRVKFTSELGLVKSVVDDFFLRKYFLVERELQEAGLFDFDLEFSCKNFSSLNVCMIVLSSGGRLFEFCFTLLQVDFREIGFLLGGMPTVFLSSIDFTKFFSSLLWNVGMRISSVRLKDGTVAKGSLLLALPFYLLQFFFFLNIQAVIISNLSLIFLQNKESNSRDNIVFLRSCLSILTEESTL